MLIHKDQGSWRCQWEFEKFRKALKARWIPAVLRPSGGSQAKAARGFSRQGTILITSKYINCRTSPIHRLCGSFNVCWMRRLRSTLPSLQPRHQHHQRAQNLAWRLRGCRTMMWWCHTMSPYQREQKDGFWLIAWFVFWVYGDWLDLHVQWNRSDVPGPFLAPDSEQSQNPQKPKSLYRISETCLDYSPGLLMVASACLDSAAYVHVYHDQVWDKIIDVHTCVSAVWKCLDFCCSTQVNKI